MKLNEKSKLTGKASFDFLIKHGRIGYLQDSVQNALIVDWFDSVGIYITILPCIDKTFDSYVTMNEKRIEVCQFQPTRIEATNVAILKANELYNYQNK